MIHVNVEGAFVPVKMAFVKVDGKWRKCVGVYVRAAEWKCVMDNKVTYLPSLRQDARLENVRACAA